MSKNPCKNCEYAFNNLGKMVPSYYIACRNCQKRKAHEEYLASKRKYEKGDPITTFNELLQQKWVMLYGKTKHITVIKNMQLATVEMFMSHGAICKAIKKEEQ